MAEKILITGVSGFIGSALAMHASQNNIDVIGSSRRQCKFLESQLNIPVIEVDLRKEIQIPSGIEVVIHTATANDIVSQKFEAGISLSVNGTHNLLEACSSAGIKKFVFFSTQQVYGNTDVLFGRIDENSPIRCHSGYAMNHFLGEILCKQYARLHNIELLILRPSNVVGVPDSETVSRESLVPMCFLKEIFEKNRITLRSSGQQLRDFISTQILAQMVFKVVQLKCSKVEVLNASTGATTSIKRVAELMIEEFGNLFHKNADLKTSASSNTNINHFFLKSKFPIIDLREFDQEKMLRSIISDLLKKRGAEYYGSP